MSEAEYFSQIYPRLSGEEAFGHYEDVRQTLPAADFGPVPVEASNLADIAEHFDVFVFDAYGVLNVGSTPIANSPERVQELRKLGKKVLVLSNGASYDVDASVAKIAGMGFDFGAEEIVSSRMAATRSLAIHGDAVTWGAMAKADFSDDEFEQPTVKLADDPKTYEAVSAFLFLSTLDWNSERQQMLERAFAENPRPILVANPDIVSPREDHFGMEPGYIAHRMAKKYGAKIEFCGKPFGSVFDMVEERLGAETDFKRVCMIGDTLHTDILGAAACGWKTVLVTAHGMFKGLDANEYISRSGIVPDYVVPSI